MLADSRLRHRSDLRSFGEVLFLSRRHKGRKEPGINAIVKFFENQYWLQTEVISPRSRRKRIGLFGPQIAVRRRRAARSTENPIPELSCKRAPGSGRRITLISFAAREHLYRELPEAHRATVRLDFEPIV
jgi:hypothetical protein